MARYEVELPEEHGEELKVSYDQTSATQKVAKDAKKASVEVPDGKDFVVESGGVRQTFRAGGAPLRAAEPKLFGVRPAGGLRGVPQSDVVTGGEDTSEVANLTVPEATDKISRMRNPDTVRHIATTDARDGVKKAAEKRLEELK